MVFKIMKDYKIQIEEKLIELLADDTILDIKELGGKVALVVNHPKLAEELMSLLSQVRKDVLEEVEEKVKKLKRHKKDWHFYYDCDDIDNLILE